MRSRLRGGDIETLRTALEEYAERAQPGIRMGAHFQIFRATGDREHLAEAKRLLDYRVEHAPEEYHESMLANVTLHRDIVKAWQSADPEGAQSAEDQGRTARG